ncbi:hypothetical protein D9M71_138300 [compost metagenome]
MAEKRDLAQVVAVEPVVVAATAQGRAGHVEVDHVARAAFDGRHREATGVGEQVQHSLALCMGADPVAAIAHVEEQPGVLLATQVHPVLQATLGDGHFFDDFAQQPFGGALQQVAMLQQQRMGAGFCPLFRLSDCHQPLFQVLQLRRLRLLEQRHQHHALQPVHGHLLQPRPAAATAVEQATGFGGGGREGGQQVLVEGGEGFRVHRVGSVAWKGAAFNHNCALNGPHKSPCGSGLARESGVSGNTDVD